MPIEPQYAAYAKETALCVDLAYSAMEEDILLEISRPGGPSPDALTLLLKKLHDRRAALESFTSLVPRAA